jgi:membrane-associated PAP2 superfamily phosphatase
MLRAHRRMLDKTTTLTIANQPYAYLTQPAARRSMPPAPDRHRARLDLAVCVALWLIALMFDASGADHWLTRLYGTAEGFAWRDHWLTNDFMHRGGRVVSWLLFAVTLWWVSALWQRWPAVAAVPVRTRIWWLACTVLCLAVIPVMKYYSLTSCPWDLLEFGGKARWVSHWAFGVPDGGPGRCFPSGHASGAFAFAAGYFALRDTAPRLARVWLALVVALGIAFGWAQLMRGAHHLSHTLWTAAICWAITVLSFHATRGWRAATR